MRALSSNARAALYAAASDDVWLQLVTITHASIATPIRLVDNTEDIVSDGQTFTAFPFTLSLPATEQQSVELVVDNVTQLLIDEVRSIDTPLDITLEVVLASAPDIVEAGPFVFQTRGVEYDQQRMTFALSFEPLLQEPFPAGTYTPIDYPGLFQAVDR